jgi:uncharacterized protein YneF (UPF0154 family)
VAVVITLAITLTGAIGMYFVERAFEGWLETTPKLNEWRERLYYWTCKKLGTEPNPEDLRCTRSKNP